MNLSEYIQKALIEAHKQRISANTVLLNEEIALVKGGYEKMGNTVAEIPPIGCSNNSVHFRAITSERRGQKRGDYMK